jgi:cytochrome c-type biogenesis protein CcmH
MKPQAHIPAARVLVLLLAVALLALPARAVAQGPEDAPTVSDVAQELYCPLCAGLTVDVCELEVCDDMRAVIAERLAAGESPEQIQAYFVEQYGQKVVGKPATTGFDLTAWVVPFVALAGAGALTVGWLRRRPAVAGAGSPGKQATLTDEYAARLERELKRLEE